MYFIDSYVQMMETKQISNWPYQEMTSTSVMHFLFWFFVSVGQNDKMSWSISINNNEIYLHTLLGFKELQMDSNIK